MRPRRERNRPLASCWNCSVDRSAKHDRSLPAQRDQRTLRVHKRRLRCGSGAQPWLALRDAIVTLSPRADADADLEIGPVRDGVACPAGKFARAIHDEKWRGAVGRGMRKNRKEGARKDPALPHRADVREGRRRRQRLLGQDDRVDDVDHAIGGFDVGLHDACAVHEDLLALRAGRDALALEGFELITSGDGF